MTRRCPGRTGLIALLAGTLLPLAAGCGDGLISRDDYVQALMEQNRQLETDLLAAEKTVAELQAGGARPQPLPEPPQDPYRPVAIRLGTTTAALDTDGDGRPDRLKVVLEPLDAEGDVVKRAGRLDLEALLPQGDDTPPQPYHAWTFSQEDVAQTWIGSLGIRAYVMKLRWPQGRPPEGKTLLVRARFTPLAGEALTAETTVPLKGAP